MATSALRSSSQERFSFENVRLRVCREVLVRDPAEVGKATFVSPPCRDSSGLMFLVSRFHLPFSPQRKPIEPFGHGELARGVVEADRLPVRIIRVFWIKIRGTEEAVRDAALALLHEAAPASACRSTFGSTRGSTRSSPSRGTP